MTTAPCLWHLRYSVPTKVVYVGFCVYSVRMAYLCLCLSRTLPIPQWSPSRGRLGSLHEALLSRVPWQGGALSDAPQCLRDLLLHMSTTNYSVLTRANRGENQILGSLRLALGLKGMLIAEDNVQQSSMP